MISSRLSIAMPKGRLWSSVYWLLKNCGIEFEWQSKLYSYKVKTNWGEFQLKVYKNRDIPGLVERGLMDIGFSSWDRVYDSGAKVVRVMDMKTDKVRIAVLTTGQSFEGRGRLRCATEYPRIATEYLYQLGQPYEIIEVSGCAESYVPDQADMAIDVVMSGNTASKNGLQVKFFLFDSTIRLIANKQAYQQKKELIKQLQKRLK